MTYNQDTERSLFAHLYRQSKRLFGEDISAMVMMGSGHSYEYTLNVRGKEKHIPIRYRNGQAGKERINILLMDLAKDLLHGSQVEQSK